MDKCVILAGGRGSRLGNLSDSIPKPMVQIGGIPIIDHIINKFIRDVGACEFIVVGGYRCDILQEHFDGYSNVKVIYTGSDTNTAGRVKRLESILDGPFYMCYGDGLTDFRLSNLNIENVNTILMARPIGRFGEVETDNLGYVTSFSEKPSSKVWINGGFFHLQPSSLSYIFGDGDDWSKDIFPRMVKNRDLVGISYEGFWHCMDTPKDVYDLDEQFKMGKAKWIK